MKNQNRAMAAVFRYARITKKLSQRKFALLLGVNQSTVSRIEKGVQYPWRRTIARLEQLTEITVDEILPEAMEAQRLSEAVQERYENEKITKKTISEADLTGKDLQYIECKREVELHEKARDLGRRRYRLQHKIKRHFECLALIKSFQEQVRQEKELYRYLTGSGAAEELVRKQAKRIDMAMMLSDSLSGKPSAIDTALLYLEQKELEFKNVLR